MISSLCYLMHFLLILVLLLLLFLRLFYNWQSTSFRRKYRKLPAPRQTIVFGMGLEMARVQAEGLWNFYTKLIETVGRIGCFEVLGAPSVYLMAVEDIEVLFSSSQYVSKGFEYVGQKPWLREGLNTSTGAKWQFRRRLLTPTFHFKILENFLPIFNKNAQQLTTKLSAGYADLSKPVEVGPIFSVTVLGNICETTMGMSLDYQSDEGSKYVAATQRICKLIARRIMTFWLFSDWAFNLSPTGREFTKVVGQTEQFINKVIKERKENYKRSAVTSINSHDDCCSIYKKRISFLDLLIEFQRDQPEFMTDDDIREEVHTFMFAGHATVAATISWTLFMVALHSDVQEKLQQEMKQIFGYSQRDITFQDINKMKYLDMVLKETLRLYPAVPYLSRRIPVDLQTKDQHMIPAGMNVVVMPYLLHRDPLLYPDPEKFDADRFLPDVAKKRHPYAYIPFSAGFRNCLGQRFATLESKIMLASILRRLRVSTTLKKSDVKPIPNLILRPSPAIALSFSPVRSGF